MSKRKRALKQHDNKIGYWTGKGDQREFVPLANFGVRILRFVTAPAQLPDYKGFIVEVTQVLKRQTLKG